LDQIDFLSPCDSLYITHIFSQTFTTAGKTINYGPKDNYIKPAVHEHNLRYQQRITKYILVRKM